MGHVAVVTVVAISLVIVMLLCIAATLSGHVNDNLIERVGFLAGGRAVELTRSIYRGDAYDFVAELNLPDQRA